MAGVMGEGDEAMGRRELAVRWVGRLSQPGLPVFRPSTKHKEPGFGKQSLPTLIPPQPAAPTLKAERQP